MTSHDEQDDPQGEAPAGAPTRTFMDDAIAGMAGLDIDERIEAWHRGEGQGLELHEFLGMSRDEYVRWVSAPDQLATIVAARRSATALPRGALPIPTTTSIPPAVYNAIGQLVAHASRSHLPQSGRIYDVQNIRAGLITYGDWRVTVSKTRASGVVQTPEQRTFSELLPSIVRVVEASLSNPDILTRSIAYEGAIETPAGPRRWTMVIEDVDAKEAMAFVEAGGTRQ